MAWTGEFGQPHRLDEIAQEVKSAAKIAKERGVSVEDVLAESDVEYHAMCGIYTKRPKRIIGSLEEGASLMFNPFPTFD